MLLWMSVGLQQSNKLACRCIGLSAWWHLSHSLDMPSLCAYHDPPYNVTVTWFRIGDTFPAQCRRFTSAYLWLLHPPDMLFADHQQVICAVCCCAAVLELARPSDAGAHCPAVCCGTGRADAAAAGAANHAAPKLSTTPSRQAPAQHARPWKLLGGGLGSVQARLPPLHCHSRPRNAEFKSVMPAVLGTYPL